MSDPHDVQTPAYVFDENTLRERFQHASDLCGEHGIQLLFPLKTLSFQPILEIIANYVSGFSASSPFELRLADALRDASQTLHFTSPGVRRDDKDAIVNAADFISCNSLTQRQFFNASPQSNGMGLRINPLMSFVDDERCDPCRRHSKLGVPVTDLAQLGVDRVIQEFGDFDGLHVHSNSESESFDELLDTVKFMANTIPAYLAHAKWFNLGGGYLFEPNDAGHNAGLERASSLLRDFDLELFIEPGMGVLSDVATLETRVLDVFQREGKHLVVVDTSVNHFPEILEFEYVPEFVQAVESGPSCIVAGCTCLAGDLFGEHHFEAVPTVGDRLTIRYAAAYTLVKAHTFNGVNLPDVYLRGRDGKTTLLRRYSYEDYLTRHGAKAPCV